MKHATVGESSIVIPDFWLLQPQFKLQSRIMK